MANDCAQLRIELAALKQEISKLQRVDEESIIKKAVDKAQALLKPEIGALGIAVAGAVKQADLSIYLTKQLRPQVTQAVLQSRSASQAAEFAKKIASGAEVASEVASIKSGKAFIEASKAGAVSQVSLKTAAAAQSAAAATGATASRAITIATIAQGTATAANAFAASAIGRTVLLAANVLSLAGSIAGLFSLYATLKIVFPRLDAHDRQLDAHNNQISRNASEIYRLNEQTKKANYIAEIANKKADRNADEIYRTNITAKEGKYIAEIANAKGNQSLAKIPTLEETAKSANYKADISNSRATQALTGLTAMQGLVNSLNAEVQTANGRATDAIGKANTATKNAEKATEEANIATGKANNALKEIDLTKLRISQIGIKADTALGKATAVEPIANQAIQQVSQVRPISEQALTNAFNALNRVNTVEPVANNAFTATQLQGTQLKGTKLEVTGLGKTAKLQEKKIVELGDRISNFKPPTTTTPEVDKEALEKLTQVVVSVGALKIAMDNMPRNIANSPAFQGAVTTAATTANCRTAAPGGCTTRMVNNAANTAANNASNNLLSKLGGAFNTGANAAQLALLQPIKNGVDLANSKLGAPIANGGISGFLSRLSSSLGIDRALNLIGIASNLHNAMMLSASLKITLLEMLSSVGNATGLLQTSENENVDLNAVFNQGIETFMVSIMGAENYAGLKVNLRKYNAIYRAATNSLNAVSSMFNSIGDAIETTAEHTSKIGNALRAASVVRENAYNFMSEKIAVKTSRFMTFQTKVGDVAQVLETINEIAENVVEGQQQYTEAVKATTDFKKALADADRPEAIDNILIKAEAEKIKANLVKDPTGEDETGLLSVLTD